MDDTSIEELRSYIINKKEGGKEKKRIQLRGYTSAYINQRAAMKLIGGDKATQKHQVLLKIKIQKSRWSCYYLDANPNYNYEQEVVFSDGIGFYVEGIEKKDDKDGKTYIQIALCRELKN